MNTRNILALFCALSLLACKENVDESMRYVFKENTAASYLKKHEQYSEYYRLMGETPVSDLT